VKERGHPLIRTGALALGLVAAGAAGWAPTIAPAAGEIAAGALADGDAATAGLAGAIEALRAATTGEAQIAALTGAIRAYEVALADLRDALRQASLRERALAPRIAEGSARLAAVLGALGTIGPEPDARVLLHPGGPLEALRAGLVLAEAGDALAAGLAPLRADMDEAAALAALRTDAEGQLTAGLAAVQAARAALARAMADRTDLPLRLADDPAALEMLAEDARTIAELALGLAPDPGLASAAAGFADARGRLPLPVGGRLLRGFGEPDAAGIARPGLVVATMPGALVTAPAAGTVRFRGRLGDYGNVIILEPGTGYLLVFAGLGEAHVATGEMVAAGAPLGLMPVGAAQGEGAAGGGIADQTLYMELRMAGEPVDPAGWFGIVPR
jgi:septal ring factor EnvC (AmiA/AmiB activator)